MSEKPFLALVARDLVRRFGRRLNDVTVVFPGRRARLFLNQYLYRETQAPLWAPSYLSIDELFESLSNLRAADPLQLTGELYYSYKEVYEKNSSGREKDDSLPPMESLDEFFFFGEILLSDFDDIDKNMVNAEALFRNLEDLDRLKDDFSHLTDHQREEISRRFGRAFSGESRLQEAFLAVWNILGEVYQNLRARLTALGAGYRGMLMRDVAERETLNTGDRQYVFVGFNVLSRCEQALFKRMKNNSLFYWDYDCYYMNERHEAGRFIRENILRFGSALDNQPDDCMTRNPKRITFLASPSENGQSGAIPVWLKKIAPLSDTPDSAIILCNEAILPTVMHSVSPEKAPNVNITMGFPIAQTPIARFINLLTEMQTNGAKPAGAFYFKYVIPVLKHPYSTLLFPESAAIAKKINEERIFNPGPEILTCPLLFSPTNDALSLCRYLTVAVEAVGQASINSDTADVYEGLYQESIFRAYQTLIRLAGLIEANRWELGKPTFLRLLRRLLSVTQTPFHGEPVKGLQIMGLLETRTLDFKNIILLSVNEGFMPGNQADNSFIPRFIRKELGLSTSEQEDSVYAYYFYRLLQRAENITLVYNTDKTATGKAEMSRFLLQLLVDSRLHIDRFQLQAAIKPMEPQPVVIEKSETLAAKIRSLYDFNTNPHAKSLSPSALNTFIDCSLKFYYQKIEGFAADDDLSEEMDASVFGTIFHHAAELLYRDLARRHGASPDGVIRVEKDFLEEYADPKTDFRLKEFIRQAFTDCYFNGRDIPLSQYNGEQLINLEVILRMLRRLVKFDLNRTPFNIIGLEWENYEYCDLPEFGVKLRIGGIIDRIEESDGRIRIFDYKTGGSAKKYEALADLVSPIRGRASHIFQTYVYASVLLRQNRFRLPVAPALIYLQDAGKDDFQPAVLHNGQPVNDFSEIYPEFEPLFLAKIAELFNTAIPFTQTALTDNCKYCEFCEMCARN
jgi:RecB family exonuclease